MRPVWAYSLHGIFLQLRAGKAYYSHSIHDFVAPLVVGAYMVCLQHGFPIKRGGAVTLTPRLRRFYQTRLGRFFMPTLYYYFCHEAWTPPGPYVENSRQIFSLTVPNLVISPPPRLVNARWPQKPPGTTLLLAPTFHKGVSLPDRLLEWGIFDPESRLVKLLVEERLSIRIRPHPVDAASLSKLHFPPWLKLDASVDSVRALENAGLVITDASSIGFDALFMGVPVYFLAPSAKEFVQNQVGLFDNILLEIRQRSVSNVEQAIRVFLSKTQS